MEGNSFDDIAGPAARYSEFSRGEKAGYQTGLHEYSGEILHISDGEGGQLAIIENLKTGFPDVVLVRELFGE